MSTHSSQLTHVHVFVSGQVQGVGYRFSTVSQARKLGIQGWVRNLHDGRVEAVFEGEGTQVQRMVDWCYGGSPSAVVTGVSVQSEEFEGISDFEVLY